jgi:hypothetical protein
VVRLPGSQHLATAKKIVEFKDFIAATPFVWRR